MTRQAVLIALGVLLAIAGTAPNATAQAARSGNPILPGKYADPEAHVFNNAYWIFPTYSAPYDEQRFMDAFSSRDLVTWTKHERVLDIADIPWAKRALWAPSVIEKDGWYYLFFGANDIQSDQELGGIGVARSRSPAGPFKDYLGRPLIDKFHNGAQPIDQMVFRDRDGAYYIVYGGWRHCNIARLTDDFTGFVPFADGTIFKEITPKGYVEGAYMMMVGDQYYFMWSEGGWTGPDYAVAYAVGTSSFGPFERVGTILKQDPTVATGAGHHSVLRSPASGKSYIVYHRRPLGETDRNYRVVSIEDLRFDKAGRILPVVITKEGVPADSIAPGRRNDR
jgi:beta-xylosidase